jgi:hypothetical protein
MHWHPKKPGRWLVSCRDIARRRREVVVMLTQDRQHVALIVPPGEVAELDLMAVGRLRAALRDAIRDLDDPNAAFDYVHVVPLAEVG